MRRMEDRTLAAQVHDALLARGATVATAESLTGGGVGRLLSSVAGSSATYRGGVVSYATDVKVSLLGVTEELVADQGVVSAACAEQMAVGVRELLRSDWAVSTTGVAGPTLQEGKPAGTVHVGVAGPDGVRSLALHLDGDREDVRAGTERAVLVALLDRVLGADVGPDR
jgi:nicotinamide-nucleotide amidase